MPQPAAIGLFRGHLGTRRRRVIAGLLALGLAAYLGLVFVRMLENRRLTNEQARAEDAVRRLGGDFRRYDQGTFRPWAETVVHLEAVSVGDGDLATLEAFPPSRLGGLYLGENHLTDDGLKKVGRLTNISVLDLGPRPDLPKAPTPTAGRGARITDEGLLALKPLSKLLRLGLQGTPIGDAGLDNLRGVGRDHNGQLGLSLAGTQVTDAGLSRLPDLFPNLHWLELDGCAITDQGLAHLGRLKRLSHLSLNDTRVGDEGLRHLVDLGDLHRLQLDRTRITDQGLAYLKVMKGPLGFVSLQGTGTTAAKLVELRQSRSKLQLR
jgi:internalin A